VTTLAIDRYDRHFPFFDGTVHLPEGLDLDVLQVGQDGNLRLGRRRHERFLQKSEFDVAECSLASYITAKGQGLPFTAIPVFPRRLFSLGQIFVNKRAGIREPTDLAGRKVGLQSFQTTLAVLAKGDMAHEYGLALNSVHWKLRNADAIDVAYPADYSIAPIEDGKGLVEALAEGALDAVFMSRTPWAEPDPDLPIRRLFEDPRAAEAEYYARNGFWPIMHVVAIRDDVVARQPELPKLLMKAFDSAHDIYMGYVDDPGWSRLAWTKYAREEESARLGRDLWPSGLAANRANLERFIGYTRDQGMVTRDLTADELFHESVRDS
jgi:4,5-dihydroxyphthalate decarboxylase